jgi:ubiquinone/menaquinone biosynthesis C-methylase UbiE
MPLSKEGVLMSDHDSSLIELAPEVIAHYSDGREGGRLFAGTGPLELERTRELVRRFLPPPPAIVCDVGGGTGVYACWLAAEGYETHLVDAVPLHVEHAVEASRRQPAHPLASAVVGDARRLERDDESADAVLLLGPLYHLVERQDRVAALREARRVLRARGLVFAAGISRFASTLDGLVRRLIDDSVFAGIVERDLADGQHRNPTDHPSYFTTAYFHRPEELAAEFDEVGLRHQGTFAIEGPAWAHARRNFVEVESSSPDECAHVLDRIAAVYRVEAETKAKGMSAAERLAHHQHHSAPVLGELRVWIRERLELKVVEPSSSLGDALTYMLDHFDDLEKFTTVAGAPIDNTLAERVLKLVVLSRKNSLFFKNENGASIGDRMAGLVETCRLNGVAAYDYMLALVRNADRVRAAPSEWLPWTYPRQSATAKAA